SPFIKKREDALKDKSPAVQRAAAAALGRMGVGTENVVTDLSAAFERGNMQVKVACIEAIARTRPTQQSINWLSTMIDQSGAPELKHAAAYALAEIGPAATSAVPSLKGALVSKDADLRQVAGWALGLFGPGAASATPELVTTLRDSRESIRRVSADALRRIGSNDAYVVAALTEAL